MQIETHNEFEFQNHCAAMIRSLSGESTADIRDWHLFHKAQPYAALSPHLNLSNLKEEWNDQRGLLDGIALRLKFSNKDLYESHLSLIHI